MNSTDDRDENNMGAHLHALGRDMEQQAPAFKNVWRKAQQALAARENARQPSPTRWMQVTAVATVALCLAAVLWLSRPPQRERVTTPHVASIPEIAPADDAATPTDFLLTAANDSHEPSIEQLTREIDALLKP
jgi:hypothetical protein